MRPTERRQALGYQRARASGHQSDQPPEHAVTLASHPTELSMRVAGLLLLLAPLGIATSARRPNAERAEITRIRNHFDSVLTELRGRDVLALTAAQRANRETLMVTLAAYRNRGVFPHNYDFPDAAMPYFVDRKTGTLCAVAHLLESTGRRDIVDRVARMNNNVWVAELAGDTALATWLDRNGLTLGEAARIQVPYVDLPIVTPTQKARNTAYVAIAPAAAGVAAVTTVWNLASNRDGHRRGVSWSGVGAGVLTSTAGILLMKSPNPPQNALAIGATTAALGGLSILTSTRSIYRHRVIAQREAEAKKRVAEAVVSPLVGFDRGNPSLGASLSLRF